MLLAVNTSTTAAVEMVSKASLLLVKTGTSTYIHLPTALSIMLLCLAVLLADDALVGVVKGQKIYVLRRGRKVHVVLQRMKPRRLS